MKKLLSATLATLLVFGMSTVAFAAPSGKITGATKPISTKDFESMEVAPGKVIELPLTADLFEWEEGTGSNTDPVTESQLSSGKVTVKVTYDGKSKDVIKKIGIDSKKFSGIGNGDKRCAYIKIEFLDEYTQVSTKNFEFTVYLSVKSNRMKDTGVTFSGEFGNSTILLESDEDYVDLSGGEVAEVESYLRSVEAYIGAGVSIHTKMYENKKYYGTATEGITEADEKIMDAYEEIETVFTLNTVNLSSGKVVFDLDEVYHVYNKDGKYVGKSDSELAYSDKFYMATKKIDMSSKNSNDDDEDDEDDEEEITPSAPAVEETLPTYSNDYYNSINDNPSTGAGRLLQIASLTGVLALAAVFVIAKRSK